MKRVLLPILLSTAIILGLPQVALAKAPTVKLTIEGGNLTKEIQVTDPRILELSHVWAGNFLDNSREPAKEPPRGLHGYEVSFYVKLADNDVQKMYVVRYYPNPSVEQGYIYLPGDREGLECAQSQRDCQSRTGREMELRVAPMGAFGKAANCHRRSQPAAWDSAPAPQ